MRFGDKQLQCIACDCGPQWVYYTYSISVVTSSVYLILIEFPMNSEKIDGSTRICTLHDLSVCIKYNHSANTFCVEKLI